MFIIDRRNALLIISVVAVFLVVGFWIPYERARNNQAEEISDADHKATVEILYTKDGFDPKTITIRVGTTVAWKNLSGLPMWVASDPHPAHTDLPGFDERGIINKDFSIKKALSHGTGVYEYTFTKLGTWNYHNHIYPAHRGTVIVEE